MPARRKSTPSYLLHKQSGKARAVWTDPSGIRQQRLLPGLWNTVESRSAHARLALELAASPTAAVARPGSLTVAELLLAYMEHANRHYRHADGTPTSEIHEVRGVVKAVREQAELPHHILEPAWSGTRVLVRIGHDGPPFVGYDGPVDGPRELYDAIRAETRCTTAILDGVLVENWRTTTISKWTRPATRTSGGCRAGRSSPRSSRPCRAGH